MPAKAKVCTLNHILDSEGAKMMMRSYLLVTAIFILAVASTFGQSEKQNARLEQEIRKLDAAHAEAILKKDVDALKKLIAEDAVTNHPTNKIVKERDGIFELIRNGTINYSSFVREPETFLFYPNMPNMVIVMGHETIEPVGKAPGAGQIVHRRYTNIWMKRNGKWQLAVRHANIVCPDQIEVK